MFNLDHTSKDFGELTMKEKELNALQKSLVCKVEAMNIQVFGTAKPEDERQVAAYNQMMDMFLNQPTR